MSDPAVAALVALIADQHGAVSRTQASGVGFGKQRVATAKGAGWLREPIPGVLIDGRRATWEQRLMVVVLAGRGAVAVSTGRRLASTGWMGSIDRRTASSS